MSSNVLRGLSILNTRPLHQQAELNALLEADGARVVCFPSIEITDIEPTEFHRNLNEQIRQYQTVIFVSRNAVDGAFKFLRADQLPGNLQLAVIGKGTHLALLNKLHGLERGIINTEPYNSEGLLSTRALQNVSEAKILIFRGQQGRTLLSDTLQQRGARVDHCEVYRRQLPEYDSNAFARLCKNQFPSLTIFTSTEGLHNLFELLDTSEKDKLLTCPWLLISERMRESALNLGHNADIIIARKASDAGIHQAILDWAQKL